MQNFRVKEFGDGSFIGFGASGFGVWRSPSFGAGLLRRAGFAVLGFTVPSTSSRCIACFPAVEGFGFRVIGIRFQRLLDLSPPSRAQQTRLSN